MKDKKCYNPPDRRRKKKVSSRSIAAKIASSMLATVTAATTIASPVLTYAADVNGMDTVTETTTDASQDETKTIINTETESNTGSDSTETENDAETKFLFVNLKTSGGKIVIDENEDDEQTVKLAKHKSDDGKTDEMRIDVYDKDDILVSSEDAAKNNYTYAYEVKADSVTNVKADADEGYILKLYDIVEGDTKKDSGFDEETDGIAGEFEYPVFMDSNVTVKVGFEKEEIKEDGNTDAKDAEAGDLTADKAGEKDEIADEANDKAENDSVDAKEEGNLDKAENAKDETENGDLSVNDAADDSADATTDEATDGTGDEQEPSVDENAVDESDAESTEETDAAGEANGDADGEAGADASEDEDADAADETADSEVADTDDETADTSYLDEADFSSARLIVVADDKDVIIDPEYIIGSYGNLYLMQYKDAAQAMSAYVYYEENAKAVEPDKIVEAAEGDAVDSSIDNNAEAKTIDDNAIAALKEEADSKPAQEASNVIALIDTGVNETSNVVDRISLVDNSMEGNGHGDTMLSDIVAQNPDAKVLSIRALDDNGQGSVSDIIAAMEYAMNQGVSIINLSVSSKTTLANSVLKTEIEKMKGVGITVVGAAGNDGTNVKNYMPGSVDAAYIIGACDENGKRIPSSNYGATVDYNVVAESTSEAAARFSGYISKTGISGITVNKGLVFATDYVEDSTGTDDEVLFRVSIPEKGGYVGIKYDYEDASWVTAYPRAKGYVTSDNLPTGYGIFTKIVADDGYRIKTANILSGDGSVLKELTEAAGQTSYDYKITLPNQNITLKVVFEQTRELTSEEKEYQASLDDYFNNEEDSAKVQEDKNNTLLYNDIADDKLGTAATQVHVSIGAQLEYPSGSHITHEYNVSGMDGIQGIGYCMEPAKNAPDNGTYTVSDINSSKNAKKYKFLMLCNKGFPLEGTGDNLFGKNSSKELRELYIHSTIGHLETGTMMGLKANEQTYVNQIEKDVKRLLENSYYVNIVNNYHLYKIIPSSGRQAVCFMTGRAGIEVHKTSSNPNTAGNPNYSLAGAKYTIKKGGTKIATLTTDAKGYASTSSAAALNLGTYTVQEAVAPKGFNLDKKVYTVKLTAGSIGKFYTVNSTDGPKKGGLSLRKRANDVNLRQYMKDHPENTEYSYKGAIYKVYSNSACTKLVLTLPATDATGYTKSDDAALLAGNYWIKEYRASDGFVKNTTPIPCTVTAGQVATKNIYYSDEPKNPAYLEVKKRVELYKQVIALGNSNYGDMSCTFTFYDDAKCTKISKQLDGTTNKVININKGNVEKVTVKQQVVAGKTYYLKETTQIKGTAVNEYVYGPIKVAAGETASLKDFATSSSSNMWIDSNGYVMNKPYRYIGKIMTKLAGDTKKALPNAVFRVRYREAEDGTVKRTWYVVSDSKGEVKIDADHLVDNHNDITSAYKGKSGDMFNYLVKGTTDKYEYYLPLGWLDITEMEAPDGYKVAGGTNKIQIKERAGVTSANDEKPWLATLSNTNYQVTDPKFNENWIVTVNAKKVDQNKKPLAGARFGIYETKEDANRGVNELARLTTGSDGMTPNYTYKGLDQDTDKTCTLYCKEIKAPEGYALPKNNAPLSLTFSVNDFKGLDAATQKKTGQIRTFGGSTGIVNTPDGWPYSMHVKKVDPNGNPLAGAVFSVYESKEDANNNENAIETLTTKANGFSEVKTMRLTSDVTSTTLYCRETKAPDGYKRNNTVYTQTWSQKNLGSTGAGETKFFGASTGIVNQINITKWNAKMFIKKINSRGTPLAGAVFTVYNDDSLADDSIVGTLKTASNGVSNTLTVSCMEDEVEFFCKETVAPAGYSKIDTVFNLTFTKASDNGATKQFGPVDGVVNSNGWPIKMKLQKTDNKNQPLAGAVFGIYKTEECNDDDLLTTLKSGTNGWTKTYTAKMSDDDDSVTLYCKEISAPDGYAMSDKVLKQTWTKASAGATGEEKSFGTLVNTKTWTAVMNAKKVDDSGETLADAVFGIYTNKECDDDALVGTITSGDDGWTDDFAYNVPDGLDSVTLYCQEIEAPEGYSLSQTVYNLTWKESESGTKKTFGGSSGIVNKGTWKIRLTGKKVSEKGEGLAGATFGIFTDAECGDDSQIGEITSGDDGTFKEWQYDSIPTSQTSITLFLKETEAPDGYSPATKVYKQTWTKANFDDLAAKGNRNGELKSFGNIVNTSVWYIKYQVKKVDDEGKGLAGVQFSIYDNEKCGKEDYLCTITTGDDGTTSIRTDNVDGNLNSITLYCKEVKAPSGYEIQNQKYSLTFKRDTDANKVKVFGTDGKIVNKKMKAPKVKIKKKSTAASEILGLSGYSLEGAEFTITDGKDFTKTLTTNAKGETEELELPITASYTFGNKYTDPKLNTVTTEYTITETKAPKGHIKDSTPQKISVTCPTDGGTTKTVEFSDEPIFTTDEFQITKTSKKGNPVAGVVFKVEFIDGVTNTVGRTWYLVSDKNGLVKMTDSYKSSESTYKSDAFYMHNKKAVIPIGGKLRITEMKAPGQYVVDGTPKYLATGKDAKMKLAVTNDLKPCKIVLKKYDSDGKTPLAGVKFELKFLEETEKSTNATGYTRLLTVGKSIERTTDSKGMITFDNLDQGKYQITETRTTAGHTLLKDPIVVTVPITMTDEEVKKNNADTSKAVKDPATGKWMFFECTYEVTNTATFQMPITGGFGDWKYGIIGFGTLAAMGTGLILMDTRKKRMLNSRKHKRRRK